MGNQVEERRNIEFTTVDNILPILIIITIVLSGETILIRMC